MLATLKRKRSNWFFSNYFAIKSRPYPDQGLGLGSVRPN